MDALEPGALLLVRTRKSSYAMVVLNGRRRKVLLRGGAMFQDGTEGIVQGSVLCGNLLKTGRIVVGLRLELVAERKRIVTSRVDSIHLVRA